MKNNSNIPLISFSLLTVLHDQKKDLLEAFLPFVEFGIYNIGKEYIDIKGLRSFIEKIYYINFPINTLTTLLKKLARNEKIQTYEDYRKIKVIDASKNIADYQDLFESCGRENRKFVYEYKKFANLQSTDDEEIFKRLQEFITFNIDQINLLGDYDKSVINDIRFISISDFILHIKKYDNSLFDAFRKIYYGYLLSKITDLNQISTSKEKGNQITIILDSNFLFRLLDLQNPLYNEASNELYEILKKEGYALCTFKEIIEEIRSVLENLQLALLNSYLPEKMSEEEAILLSGVQGGYYRKLKTLSNLNNFIRDIENKIESLGIKILKNDTLHNIKPDNEFYENLYNSRLRKIKNNNIQLLIEDDFSLHSKENKDELFLKNLKKKVELDSKIVKYIFNKREGKVYNFSKSKLIFLSCDKSIFKINYQLHGNSVPEVISEEMLTNTLWIRNPNKVGDVSIDLSLSAFQSSKYISYDSMISIYSIIENFTSKNPTDAAFIGDIFSNQFMASKINNIESSGDDNKKNELYHKLVKDLVEQNKKMIQEEADKLLSEKRRRADAETELKESIKSNSAINKKRENDKKEISKYKSLYKHYSNSSSNDIRDKTNYLFFLFISIYTFTNTLLITYTINYLQYFIYGFISLNLNEILSNSKVAIPILFYLIFSIYSSIGLKSIIVEYHKKNKDKNIFLKYFGHIILRIFIFILSSIILSILIGIFTNLYSSKTVE